MTTSAGVMKAINAGVHIESVSASEKVSDGLIQIGHAIIAKTGSFRIVDSHTLTSDAMIKIHNALAGKVVFEGA